MEAIRTLGDDLRGVRGGEGLPASKEIERRSTVAVSLEAVAVAVAAVVAVAAAVARTMKRAALIALASISFFLSSPPAALPSILLLFFELSPVGGLSSIVPP